jgi:hypothetical protein
VLGIAAITAAPSMASTTVYGSAQIKYTVNAVTLVSIATNYATSAPFGQSGSAATILPSTAAMCAAGAVETTATLTFGGVTPPSSAGYTGCYYKNALEIGINSNDAIGYNVYEYLDTAVTGTAICLFPLGSATPAATPTVSGASGNPTAYNGAACPTVNSVAGKLLTYQGAAVAGTGFGGASNPGTGTWDVTATPTATTYVAGPAVTASTATQISGWAYVGQDVQLNVGQNAAAQADTNVLTVAVIPN